MRERKEKPKVKEEKFLTFIHLATLSLNTHTLRVMTTIYYKKKKLKMLSNPIYKDKGRRGEEAHAGLSQFSNHSSGQVPESHRAP